VDDEWYGAGGCREGVRMWVCKGGWESLRRNVALISECSLHLEI
jgi:hypothetical protein